MKVDEGIGAFIPHPIRMKDSNTKTKNRRICICLLWL